MVLVNDGDVFSENTRLFLTIGLLGSFTTFSTFGYETVQLIQANELLKSAGYLLGNVVIGLLAVLGGGAGGRFVLRILG